MSEPARDEPNETLGVLREILKWIRVTSMPNVKKLLVETLDDDKSKLAYHHSDGCSSRDVAKAAACSQATVVSYWKRWSGMDWRNLSECKEAIATRKYSNSRTSA
jgi:hypothetical protein